MNHGVALVNGTRQETKSNKDKKSGKTVKEQKKQKIKKPYSKPVLKAVRVRPREVLGSTCHNSTSHADMSTCDLTSCAY